jgi:hypothetical protein
MKKWLTYNKSKKGSEDDHFKVFQSVVKKKKIGLIRVTVFPK